MAIIGGAKDTEKIFDGLMLDGEKRITEYVEVKNLYVEGKIFFLEDVDADMVEIEGEAEFSQMFTFDSMTLSGTGICLARSSVSCENAVIEGAMTVYGKMSCEKIMVTGMLDAMKNVKLWDLSVTGRLYAHDSLRFENMYVGGMIDVNDKAKGNKVNIASSMSSRIRSLSADSVTVENDGSAQIQQGVFLLESDMIDSDYVDIDFCKIDRLYCENGQIGDYCEINELYYTGEVKIGEKAKINKTVKL